MKIGIITFHRLYNFGSVLQAYALNKYLSSRGYEVKTIDYLQPEQTKKLSTIYESPKSILAIARNIQTFIYKNKILKSRNRFRSFVEEFIPTTNEEYTISGLKNLSNDFQFVICGSDQIWNTRYFGFDTAYLLDFVNDKSKCISYAASIGHSVISNETGEMYKAKLSNFKKVLVREKQAANILNKYLGYYPQTVLDPVFLIEKEDWEKLMSKRVFKKPYSLCYFIGNIDGMRKYANELKRKTKTNLVVIRINLRDMLSVNNKLYECGPLEFLRLIKDAECVFTNSFHAVAFSLIMHKRFWVFQNAEKGIESQSRIENLLDKVNLANRILTKEINISSIKWTDDISFKKSDEALEIEKRKSKELLNEALGSE